MVAKKIAGGFDSPELLHKYLSDTLYKIKSKKENTSFATATKEFYRGGEVRK